MTQFPIDYLLARLWSDYFPTINNGNHMQVITVYKALKNYPHDNPVVVKLREECIKKLNQYGIDTDYIL
jgi:predicted  nucleic acid-binding Zn ribbon protein